MTFTSIECQVKLLHGCALIQGVEVVCERIEEGFKSQRGELQPRKIEPPPEAAIRQLQSDVSECKKIVLPQLDDSSADFGFALAQECTSCTDEGQRIELGPKQCGRFAAFVENLVGEIVVMPEIDVNSIPVRSVVAQEIHQSAPCLMVKFCQGVSGFIFLIV